MTITPDSLAEMERYYAPAAEQKCRVCGAPLQYSGSNGMGGSLYNCTSDDASPLRSTLPLLVRLNHYNDSAWVDKGQCNAAIAEVIRAYRQLAWPPGPPHDEGRDHMEEFRDFWQPLVCDGDGTLELDKVARELADLLWLGRAISVVYAHVTGGCASKPFTLPDVITQLADEEVMRQVALEVRDEMRALAGQVESEVPAGDARDAVLAIIAGNARWQEEKA